MDSPFSSSVFGDNVLLFDPSMDMAAIQRTLDALHRKQAQAQFSNERYALLFKPGDYDLDVTVDYYVQAAGLGRVPGDVRIQGTVQSVASTAARRVTTMFWRAAENFRVTPRAADTPVLWAVSQAAPYRRMHIEGDLRFDLGGWASGGFLANSRVEGTAGLSTGQQWMTRNGELGGWTGGNWNRTFVGTTGTPSARWPDAPNTVVERTPVIRDKPFLVIDDADDFGVFVPSLTRSTRGVSWHDGNEAGHRVPIRDFHIAFPARDSAASINAALAAGRHVLFTPGIYRLEDAIRVQRPHCIVMGMGLATLVPANGRAALVTDDVPGITIASLMVDAGEPHSECLVEIGPPGCDADHRDDPIVLHDVFCRVGGATPGSADACLVVNSHHVIIDHTWLWRADHGAGARWHVNRANNGLIVNGHDVTIYGLFNEHFQQYQAIWNGERGRVYFYQSELPYDPPDHESWRPGSTSGFASYKISDHVSSHDVRGLGIYSFFGTHQQTAPDVRLKSAIETPEGPGIRITHVSTFSGEVGGIDFPVNDRGEATNALEFKQFDGINPAPDV